MFGFEYGTAAVLKSTIPSKGKSANGSKAVTGTGIDSVAHQVAINTATAATFHALALNSAGDGNSKIIKNNAKPIQNPLFLYADIYFF